MARLHPSHLSERSVAHPCNCHLKTMPYFAVYLSEAINSGGIERARQTPSPLLSRRNDWASGLAPRQRWVTFAAQPPSSINAMERRMLHRQEPVTLEGARASDFRQGELRFRRGVDWDRGIHGNLTSGCAASFGRVRHGCIFLRPGRFLSTLKRLPYQMKKFAGTRSNH